MIGTAERFLEYKYRDIEDRSRPFWTGKDKSTREYRKTPGGKRIFVYENRERLRVSGGWREDGAPLYYRKTAPGFKDADTVLIEWNEKGRLEKNKNCTMEEAEEIYADMVEYWKQAEGVAE
jgi:hypothetical protein